MSPDGNESGGAVSFVAMSGRTVTGVVAVLILVAAGCGQAGTPGAMTATEAASRETGSPGGDAAMTPKYSKSGYDITPLPAAEVASLAAKLSPEAYKVTQNAGTEPAFCGNLLDNHKDGVYVCVVCGLPVFSSEHKFNSGTGWPSFYRPVDPEHIVRKVDTSYGMVRAEILCARCGAHLGHVFDDGPAEKGGKRYCINSVCLELEKDL